MGNSFIVRLYAQLFLEVRRNRNAIKLPNGFFLSCKNPAKRHMTTASTSWYTFMFEIMRDHSDDKLPYFWKVFFRLAVLSLTVFGCSTSNTTDSQTLFSSTARSSTLNAKRLCNNLPSDWSLLVLIPRLTAWFSRALEPVYVATRSGGLSHS